jgi:hypothetical protein
VFAEASSTAARLNCARLEIRNKRNKRRVDNHFGYAESIYDEETCGTRGGGIPDLNCSQGGLAIHFKVD